jgi:mono/diheme cytochrome c family protein
MNGVSHPRFLVVGLVAAVLLVLPWALPLHRDLTPQWARPQVALIEQHCVSCHDDAEAAGGLSLEGRDFNSLASEAEVWEKVVRKVRTGMMPPAGEPRPPRAELDLFAARFEQQLDRAAEGHGSAGAPGLRRLTRTEYANVIRDLLALEVEVASLLPADHNSHGFDNMGDALGVSPALIEGYLSAAMKVSRLAVGDRKMQPSRVEYRAPGGLRQSSHIEGLPLGTRGGLLIEHTFPLDGEYEFRVSAGGFAPLGVLNPNPDPRVDVTLNGARVPVKDSRTFRLRMKAGAQRIGVALLDEHRSAGVDDVFSVHPVRGAVQGVAITGPFDAQGPGDTASRRRIFVCYPAKTADEPSCAKQIVRTLATRAFRRPVADAEPELQMLLGFYEQGRKEGGFESGIQRALARVLIDPRFIFRFESEPAELSAGESYRVSDLELASRLSFFLWSSIPDDELLQVASDGRLSGELEKQVHRMLADGRADALVQNFAAQWLHLRELDSAQPDTEDFDHNLRQAFERETQLLVRSVLREDRSIVDLLDADYTFVDERLARHYGIAGVRGSHMRRVKLGEDDPRRGLLGQGSVLTVTSVANRTSPVVRGTWVMENILGAPVPVPPAGVETNLDANGATAQPASLRQRLEQHRKDPVCASCHKIMDPIGLALENFDFTGKWRERDGGEPIDASAQLVDGTALDGPASLRAALLARSDAFLFAFTEKLLTYALGRGLEAQDMPTVRAIVREAAGDHYRLSALILGIARSTPFQMRTRQEPT